MDRVRRMILGTVFQSRYRQRPTLILPEHRVGANHFWETTVSLTTKDMKSNNTKLEINIFKHTSKSRQDKANLAYEDAVMHYERLGRVHKHNTRSGGGRG